MSDVEPNADEHAEPVPVGAFSDLGEAEVVQAKLRSGGIESVVDDQVEGGVLPVEGEGSVVVFVRAVDAEAARELLAAGDTDLDVGEGGEGG